MNTLLILIGKFLSFFSNFLNLGSGSTWPGHIALSLNPNFIKQIIKNNKIKIILIAGTNGKTTTGKLIQTILEKNNRKVFQNQAGANLLNGIASSLILNSNLNGKINKEFAIFEIDENTLPLILKEIENPDYVVLLNLFRDQLDRYGEVNTITKKWSNSLKGINSYKSILILNADDPTIAYLGEDRKNTHYFGLDDHNLISSSSQYVSDASYCPKCNSKLEYQERYYSHLGNWSCTNCGLKRPELCESAYPKSLLTGTYNKYNLLAALTITKLIGTNEKIINSAIKSFKPAFGRQEILNTNSKKVQIFLSKNPTSLNESLRTIVELKAKNLMIILNDRIPDGRDVSWIWDVDFEDFCCSFTNVIVSGDRTYDIGLRLKYAQFKNYECISDLSKAITTAIANIPIDETLYILPTYSAMLEIRKILTGKKIL